MPLVLVDPDESPTVCLQVNREWIPYILGALKQLVLQTTWDTSDPDALNLVQARAMTLIAMFQQSLRQPGCDGCCQEYPMSDEIFTWAPQNPYTEPDLVPDGYRFPPWFVAPDSTIIPGIKAGDIVTDLLHAPYNPLANGFPRFRVAVKGAGTVEVKFVRFPTASIALWTIDGSIGSARWTDLHASLEAAIGSFDPEMVIPIEIIGMGDHVVDISIIASISEDPPFVHFGGGIRAVSLCGFVEKQEPHITLIDESEYEMALCEQLRLQDGKLQALCCGEWTDIPGQEGVTLDGPTQPGSGSPQPAAGGGCQTYHARVNANSQWLIPTVVNTGDVLNFSGAKGAGTDGTGIWYCPDGEVFIAGGCFGGQFTSGGDPAPAISHMRLIVKIGSSTYYPADGGSITVPAGISGANAVLQVNDASLGDNSGDYVVDVEVCNNVATRYSHTWNFATGPGAWSVAAGLSGGWVGGKFVGFLNSTALNNRIHLCLPTGAQIDHFTVKVNIEHTLGGGVDFDTYVTCPVTTQNGNPYHQTLANGSTADQNATISAALTIPSGTHDVQIEATGETTAAYSEILSVTLEGPGTDPF